MGRVRVFGAWGILLAMGGCFTLGPPIYHHIFPRVFRPYAAGDRVVLRDSGEERGRAVLARGEEVIIAVVMHGEKLGDVEWTIDNPEVMAVSPDDHACLDGARCARIRGLREGTAVITARTTEYYDRHRYSKGWRPETSVRVTVIRER